MTYHLDRMPGERDALCIDLADRDRVRAALEAELLEAGYAPANPGQLPLLGRWFHGEEARHLRRFLVAPPSGRWTVVLPSGRDWDGELAAHLARRLSCRCIQLMLHDSDVLTLDLARPDGSLEHHVSSTAYFDLPPQREGEVGFDLGQFLPCCRDGVTAGDVMAALSPAGVFDVDGDRAFDQVLDLLGLPPGTKTSYRLALEDDGRTLRPAFGAHEHLAFRGASPEDGPSPGDDGDRAGPRGNGPGTGAQSPASEGPEPGEGGGEGGGRLLRFPKR